MESKKRLLITGGAGYVGSQLALNALKSGFLVSILDTINPNEQDIELLIQNPSIIYFYGNLIDSAVLENCTKNIDFIVHLAGISDGRAGKENPELTKKINIDTLDQLLTISKKAGVKRFIFASTMGVYGNSYKVPLTEDLELKPIDPYSESKAIGEKIVLEANSNSFSTLCLRMAMVYGLSPKMRFDFIVNRLTLDAIQKKTITIMGGSQKRPQIHIDDLCELFLELFIIDEKLFKNQCYNAVGQNPSIEAMIHEIQNQLSGVEINKLPIRENEDSFEMDGNKLIAKTGIIFKRNLKIGIKEIINK